MAVTQEKIKERLRALFPKANLSKTRLDAIAAKLASKPADDATDDQVDEIITDYNEVIDFEQIAKDDDRIRTLEARRNPKPSEPKPSDDLKPTDDDDAPAWAKALQKEIASLKAEKQQQTISERFTKAAKAKGIPEAWVKRSIPSSEDEIENTLADLESDWKDFAEKNKLEKYVDDTPGGGTPAKKGAPNKISADEAKKIVSQM